MLNDSSTGFIPLLEIPAEIRLELWAEIVIVMARVSIVLEINSSNSQSGTLLWCNLPRRKAGEEPKM